ncbi:MAG: hypothetical protein ABIO70_35595 [Pseudomonadota bacterium]
MWCRAALTVALLGSSAPARSESLVGLYDPAYGTGPGPGERSPVPARIRQIAYPVLGMPALVQAGEGFSALIRAECDPDFATLEAWAELVRLPEVRVPLAVLALSPEPGAPGLRRLHLAAPASMPADSWDLGLDDGVCLRDRQPSALRTYRPDDSTRIAVLADEQIGDPTALMEGGTANGTLFPTRGLADVAARRRLQVREELEFLDPLLVLYPGDMVFGMDYAGEYAVQGDRLASARLAVYAVPGNHDAYTLHSATLEPGWHASLPRAAFCVGRWRPTEPLDSLITVGGCAVERLGTALSYRLETDGQRTFQRVLGPDTYAFEVAGVRFIGLDTYGGSVARRQAVPLTLGRLGDWLALESLEEAANAGIGAPLVDNYGGFLAPEAVSWATTQAREAQAMGQGVVVFGHHDPTGSFFGQPGVVADDPFGTDPVGLGAFEVWNYDGGWDSDPRDGVGRESAARNGGTAVAQELAALGATWVCGHAHGDAEHTDARGLRVVQATTAGASLAREGEQRGYRLLELEHGRVGASDFDPSRGWASVPLGNFWTEPVPRPDGPADRAVVSGLPVPLDGRLRFDLPPVESGYRFWISGKDIEGEQPLPMAEHAPSSERFVAWLAVEAPAAHPAGPVAKAPAELARRTVRWEVAEGNEPPRASIQVPGLHRRASAPLRVRAGRPLRLSAAASRDEGPLLSATWSLGGLELRGFEQEITLATPGRYPLRLVVVDAEGATGEAEAEVRVRRGRQIAGRRALRGAAGERTRHLRAEPER